MKSGWMRGRNGRKRTERSAVEHLRYNTPALLERAIIKFLRKELEIKLPRGLVMAYIEWAKVKWYRSEVVFAVLLSSDYQLGEVSRAAVNMV